MHSRRPKNRCAVFGRVMLGVGQIK